MQQNIETGTGNLLKQIEAVQVLGFLMSQLITQRSQTKFQMMLSATKGKTLAELPEQV